MKKVICFLLVISCFTSVFAQEPIEGFIVRASGDTMRGFIQERFEWTKAQYVEFSTTVAAEPTRIPMDDVDNFYLKKYDNYFFRRIVDVDKKPVETSRLEWTAERKIVTDTIVIRLLIKGAMNLYDYVDEIGKKHFYVQKGGGKIEELAYVRYLAIGGAKLVEMPFFVAPLQAMLSDCDKVGKVSPQYAEKPLRRVITQYNSCFSTTQYAVKKVKGSVRLSVFAGGGPSFPDYKGIDLANAAYGVDAGTAEFSSTTAVAAGLNIEVISGREAARFIPGFQIGYLKTGTVTAERVFGTSRRDLSMDFSMATALISLKYILTQGTHWETYVKGAVGGQLLLSSTSKYYITDFTFNTKTEPQDFAIYKKAGVAYLLGIGTSYDRFSLELDFQQNVAVATVTAQGIVNTVAATLGFRLSKR